MKILTKYILKEISGPLLFGFFAFLSMFLGLAFIDILGDANKYQLTLGLIVKLLVLRTPEYMIQTTPIAVLLGTLLGLGNLTSHSETIAMRASGLNFVQLVVPVMLIGLFTSIGGVILNEYVVPRALRAYESAKDAALRERKTGVIPHFSYDFREGDVIQKRLYAVRFDPASETMDQVTIEEFKNGQLSRIIQTSKMYWEGGGWFFKKGSIYQINDDNFYPIKVEEGYIKYQLNLTPTEIRRYDEDPDNKSISELRAYINKHTAKKSKERQQLLVDWHMKFSIPCASFILALLGTPVALQPQRRSGAAGFGLCILFILCWYALMGIGSYLAGASIIAPFFGAWLPNLVLAGYGIHIFTKVKI
ncbi:MAG TPA: LptF/LptG family permease [Bacillota bacterium]